MCEYKKEATRESKLLFGFRERKMKVLAAAVTLAVILCCLDFTHGWWSAPISGQPEPSHESLAGLQGTQSIAKYCI